MHVLGPAVSCLQRVQSTLEKTGEMLTYDRNEADGDDGDKRSEDGILHQPLTALAIIAPRGTSSVWPVRLQAWLDGHRKTHQHPAKDAISQDSLRYLSPASRGLAMAKMDSQ